MSKKYVSFVILALCVCILQRPSLCRGTSIEDQLTQLFDRNATRYLQPIATAFGMDMNSGLYHTAKPHHMGGFDVGLRTMIAFVPDEEKTFTPVFGDPFELTITDPITNQAYTVTLDPAELWVLPDKATTIVGESGSTEIAPDEEYVLDQLQAAGYPGNDLPQGFDLPLIFPGGVGTTTIPMLVPQVSVGLPMGTEVLLRYVPPVTLSDKIGDITLYGFGITHSIDQWIPVPMFPVNIAAQFAYQRLDIADIIEAKNINFNVHASRSLPFLTLYGGLGYDRTSIDLKYTLDLPNHPLDGQKFSFSLDGDNGFRTTVGIGFSFLLLKCNVDYTIGAHNTISAGLCVTFL
jgi:hypothetical protein